ncbi:MAG: DUF971 domain-containing protein [Planctomycetes bacterium]|nr:DUF971 domain-containing protein [Planctomycetota bacterium]
MHAHDETSEPPPKALHLEKSRGLTVTWRDGTQGFIDVGTLRRMSQSADARQERESMATNPLHIMKHASPGPLAAVGAELVGNYAVRIRFSDGHDTGLFAWAYLRSLAQAPPIPSA